MSMTSKVNPYLRQRILNTLASGVTASNNAINIRLSFTFSLRTIQEATQKMTAEGVLTQTKTGRYTYYDIANGVEGVLGGVVTKATGGRGHQGPGSIGQLDHKKNSLRGETYMRKFFAVMTLALAYVASAFAQSQKPTVTDWKLIPGGPFTRVGVAPYNFYFSPTTLHREDKFVAVVVEAVPVDGTPVRYSIEGFNCAVNRYVYETYDSATDTWSDLSEIKDVLPKTANAFLEPLICQ